MTAVLEQN